MSKLLSFKQQQSEPEPPPIRWIIGIDKRQVAVYVGIALITGFTIGFATARYTQQKAAAVPSPAAVVESPPPIKSPEQPPASSYLVKGIERGDIIELEGLGKARMIGVETPDGKPQYAEQGKKALEFVQQSLRGQSVKIEFDEAYSSTQNKDAAGRTLVYIYLSEGMLFNKELLRQGHAFLRMGEPFGKMDEFRLSEQEAMRSMRGLWGPEDGSIRIAADTRAPESKDTAGDKSRKLPPLSPSEIGPNLPTSSGSVATEAMVFTSGSDRIYHKEGCELLDKKRNAVPLSQARASGHTPCGRCFASTLLKAP
jgi:micrococcal nuclease